MQHCSPRALSSRHASCSGQACAARMRVRPQPPRRARARCVRARALLATATDGVSWSQTVDEVSILVPVQPETRGRDVQLDVQPKRMALRVDGKAVLEGSLADAGEVDVLGCFWTMEEAPGGGKHVAITLAKRASGYNSWEALLESDKADLSITDRVFLEVQIGDAVAGRVAIGLFGHAAPLTAANFRALCTGEKGTGVLGKPLHFKGTPFHRIIPGFMAQGGDITEGNGMGGESIYGPAFDDEGFKAKHEEAGFVASANAGPNTNSSQFYILFGPTPHLDGKHVVFGKVLAGMDVVRRMEAVGTPGGAPSSPVTVTDCGLLEDDAAVERVMDGNKALQLDAAA